MLLWIALAVMTCIAALALLWPLTRRAEELTPQASAIAIYKDQLAEIDRDRERDLIAPEEAQAAKTEVSRRLIEADAATRPQPQNAVAGLKRRRLASVLILLFVPLSGLGVYTELGSPENPDQPLTARLAVPVDQASMDELIARAEAKLAANPNDGRGWEVMGRIYAGQQRYREAQQAYGNALRLLGSTVEREDNYGVSVVSTMNGMVTADAKAAFARAHALDAADFRAAYFLGMAREQDGDRQGAAAAWRALLAAAPTMDPDDQAALRNEIARVSGQPQPGPSQADIANAQQMTAGDRGKMIQGMVSGLASRLRSQGGTAEEWMKLVKAYSVLGQTDDARTALADARKALAPSPDEVKSLDDLGKALGL